MENQKNNKGIIILLSSIIIILLALCVLFATGTISFKSAEANSNDSNENNIIENTNNNDESYSSWVDYLVSCHILDAKITRMRSKDLGDSEDFNETVTITMNDVNELFSKFKNSKISKTWSQGRGGPDRDHLTIAYEKDDNKYEFEIYYGTIVVDKIDNDFKNVLDNSKYDEKNIEYKNTEGSFYFYSIEDYNEAIFDKYFK